MSAGRLCALCAGRAVVLLVLAGITDKGSGAGWGDGTQAVANVSWIGMFVFALAAIGFGIKALVEWRSHGGMHKAI